MRKFRFLLATLLLVAIPLGVNAEEKLIKTNFKVRKNINYVLCPDNKEFPGALLNANNSYADIQVFDFGEEGIADLHCRSDKYLAEEIWREQEK